MKEAVIYFGPVYARLIITESEAPATPLLHRKVALHLLLKELQRTPDEPNGSAALEKTLSEFLAIAEKYPTEPPRIIVSSDLANAEILVLLRLFLKRLNLPPIELPDFSAEFEILHHQLKDLPADFLAVWISEAHLRFINVKQDQPEFTFNLPCGIVPLIDTFLKNDPPDPAEIIALRDFLSTEFDRMQWHHLPEQILTFSDSGAALVNLISGSVRIDDTQSACFTKSQLQNLLPSLTHNYKSQIARLPGADPDFRDYFLTTALLYEHLLDYLGRESLKVYSQSTLIW